MPRPPPPRPTADPPPELWTEAYSCSPAGDAKVVRLDPRPPTYFATHTDDLSKMPLPYETGRTLDKQESLGWGRAHLGTSPAVPAPGLGKQVPQRWLRPQIAIPGPNPMDRRGANPPVRRASAQLTDLALAKRARW